MQKVILKFGDGEYPFLLRIGEIDELQRLTGTGMGDIVARLMKGAWYYRDIYDTIRLGLIGAGCAPMRAKQLVDLYVEGRPVADMQDESSPLTVAMQIVEAFCFGTTDILEGEEPVPEGKPQEGADPESTSPSSTDKGRASGGRRNRSKK